MFTTRGWRSFDESRTYVRGLGLKSKKEWCEWCKSGQRPKDIPVTADRVYGTEWCDWGDWLGTGAIAHQNRVWRPFEEAREYVRGLGLKNRAEYKKWCQSRCCHGDIPTNPHAVYVTEWQGMGDWLGTGTVAPFNHVWRPFEPAHAYVRGLGLKNGFEWAKWCKSGQRPTDIPAHPHTVYRATWQGMRDWLGATAHVKSTLAYRTFEEARAYVRGFGLKGTEGWYKWCKSGLRPADIPAHPARAYPDEWQGMGDWTGWKRDRMSVKKLQ